MNTTETLPTVDTDAAEVYQALAAGRPVDPEVAARVRQRAETVTEQIFRRRGVLNVAVDLIREIRDEA